MPELGARGEGWVVAQLVTMAAILVAGALGGTRPPALRVAGGVLALVGVVLFVASARALGRSLTPLPRPRKHGQLVERGPYRLARHPIYGALLLVFAGFGLATSLWALLLAGVLLALFVSKSRLEERWLEERFAGYADYRRRTPRRFLPWLL